MKFQCSCCSMFVLMGHRNYVIITARINLNQLMRGLMKCAHKDLENLRSIFLNKIYKLTPQLRKLSDIQQFVYM